MALPFSGTPLSCPTGLREDEIKLHKLKIREDALFLVCSKFNPATTESGDLFWVPWSVIHSIAADSDRPIFLGLAPDGSPRFAIEIGDSLEEWNNFIPNGFQNIRSIAAQLADNRTAIVAQAHSILKWIAHHRFCSRCGSSNAVRLGGYRLNCTNPACGAFTFPRIDPVVIIMVTSRNNQKCLLGRSHDYPDKIISPLAGFMEPGESIEDTINREIREEVGLVCTDIRFWGNQPWPFPSSLMLGCFATAEKDQLTVNKDELVFADWFTREQLEEVFRNPDGDKIFPQSISIAYHMMRAWLKNV